MATIGFETTPKEVNRNEALSLGINHKRLDRVFKCVIIGTKSFVIQSNICTNR